MARIPFNLIAAKPLLGSAVALATVQALTTKKLLRTVALTAMMVGVLHPRLSYGANDPGFYNFLVVSRSIVTPEQFNAATDDNARNAVIATLNKETGIDVSRLQSMSNQDLNNFISDWYHSRTGFYNFLVGRSIVTPEQFNAATYDNIRNAVIATLYQDTRIDGSRLQSMSNQDLNGFISDWYNSRTGFYYFLVRRSVVPPEQFNAATYDDIRNAVIATLYKDTHLDVSTLQGMSNQDLNRTISDRDSNLKRHRGFYDFLVTRKRLVTLEKFNTMTDDEIRNAVIATVNKDTRIDVSRLQSMNNKAINKFILDWYNSKVQQAFYNFLVNDRHDGIALMTPEQFNAATFDQIRNSVVATLNKETGTEVPPLQGMSNQDLVKFISDWDNPKVLYRMSGYIDTSLTVVGALAARGEAPPAPYEELEKAIDEKCNSSGCSKSPYTFPCPVYNGGPDGAVTPQDCTITFDADLAVDPNIYISLREALKKVTRKYEVVANTVQAQTHFLDNNNCLPTGGPDGTPCPRIVDGPPVEETNWGIPYSMKLIIHQKAKIPGEVAHLEYTISSHSPSKAGCPSGMNTAASVLSLLGAVPEVGVVPSFMGNVITLTCQAEAG